MLHVDSLLLFQFRLGVGFSDSSVVLLYVFLPFFIRKHVVIKDLEDTDVIQEQVKSQFGHGAQGIRLETGRGRVLSRP